ncbi:MAG: tetratricopeptide repeat protein [Kiloniellales bacterium]
MRRQVRGFREHRRRARRGVGARPVLAAALALGLVGAGFAGAAWADRGDGAVPDRLDLKAAAFRTWLPEALRGSAHAQFQLGATFLTGRSEPEDFAEAARWLKMSARQGNPRAQNGLGILYAKGLGVRRSFLEAYVWFDLAAARFEHGLRREQALELREMVRGFMSPEHLIEAGRAIEARKAGWE